MLITNRSLTLFKTTHVSAEYLITDIHFEVGMSVKCKTKPKTFNQFMLYLASSSFTSQIGQKKKDKKNNTRINITPTESHSYRNNATNKQ